MPAPLSSIEISKENILHNCAVLKSLLKPGVKVAVALKGNAYGHGQNVLAHILEPEVDFFQVDDLQELRLLRQVSNKPTLVLGYVAFDELAEVVQLEGSVAVYNKETLQRLGQLSQSARVHIMVDAFLGREGILPENLPAFLDELAQYPSITLEGVYAHFANIEDTSDFTHAQKQLDAYHAALQIVREHGYKNFLTHIAATAGSIVHEQETGAHDMVRLGIGIYGLWPSEDLKNRYAKEGFVLRPVLRWVSHVAQVRMLPARHSIGYGLTYITSRPTRIALIPQGYSDGYDRGLSNSGEVLIHGKRCRVLGRVSMNMFVVDVTHVEGVCLEDEVVLLGEQGNENITAEEIALKLGTINYEITTRISPLLPRVAK